MRDAQGTIGLIGGERDRHTDEKWKKADSVRFAGRRGTCLTAISVPSVGSSSPPSTIMGRGLSSTCVGTTLFPTWRGEMAEQVRRRRMDWLVKMLESAEPPILEKRFVAISAYNQAVSETKIREYLNLLKAMEVLEEKDEVLTWLG